jgi:hypothetical protein
MASHTFVGQLHDARILGMGALALFVAGTASATAHAQEARGPLAAHAADQKPNVPDEATSETRGWRVGANVGLGFPLPLAMGAYFQWRNILLLGAEYSMLPTVTLPGPATAGITSNIDTSAWAATGDLRVFPFGGAFFFGLRAGKQRVRSKATWQLDAQSLGLTDAQAAQLSALDTQFGVPSELNVTVDSWLINPRVGFLWRFSPGFTVGIDAGVQIPVASTTESDIPEGLGVDVSTYANAIGKTPLPTVDLLRIGFAF